MGMRVIFYDIAPIMPLGMARRAHSLNEVLAEADFVTLHVPETKDTINLIGENQIKLMKDGAYLINASRGSVVDIEALKEALHTRKLAGAAIDVFPEEPESNGPFSTGLEGLQNLIMTPHIGGSTEEAQKAIGLEVAAKMIKFINEGSSLGSVNFPEVDLRMTETSSGPFSCRVLNVHNNVPGVLKKINDILADFNIDKQISDSQGPYAYMMADVSTSKKEDLDHIFEEIYKLPDSISTRIVY
jgi:D-3-phosphoglycerate dehydrogenase